MSNRPPKGAPPHAGEIEDADCVFAKGVAIEGLDVNYMLRFQRP